ncbi:MAG: flavin reductase family protein [Candidatus Aenigmarchaeota archaeon]|nr:flavin reductase family protein [Candidatus Aenigmarchaeota archaeon]
MKVPLSNAYKLLSPRIVVLVTTVDEKGRINAAPFSFCGPISIDPPMLSIGVRKFQHTYQNIKKTGEFVVNLVTEEFAQKAIDCEKAYPQGVNELEKVMLHWCDSEKVKPPRIKEAKIHLECKLRNEIETGDHIMMVGEIVVANVEAVKENYIPDFEKLKVIMHASGESFYSVGREIKLKREK